MLNLKKKQKTHKIIKTISFNLFATVEKNKKLFVHVPGEARLLPGLVLVFLEMQK